NSPSHLAVGDFNDDGYSDVAVSGDSSNFSILLGGPAGLGPAILVTASHIFTDIQVADIDGDGKLDVLAAIYFGDVLLYPGDGTGHFGPPQSVDMGGGPSRL